MLQTVIECSGCDNKLSQAHVSNPLAFLQRAEQLGWRPKGPYGHLCPSCIQAYKADAELAEAVREFQVP